MKIADLKPFEDHDVTLRIRGGEVLRAKICFVDFEYEDIVVDIFATNQPETYKTPQASYTIAASDILDVTMDMDSK